VKTVYDIAMKAEVNASSALSNVQLKAPLNHASEEAIYGMATSSEYGHVKVVDDVNVEGGTGIVPSISIMKETNTLATNAMNLVNDIKDILTGGEGGNLLNSTTVINDIDLNTIVATGSYISDFASYELNYPYVSYDVSSLEVSSAEIQTGTKTIKQVLYSTNSLYSRVSHNSGSTWSEWEDLSEARTENSLTIYVSEMNGSDDNTGLTPNNAVQSWNRVLEIINAQSVVTFYTEGEDVGEGEELTENIITSASIFFDKGSYEIPVVQDFPFSINFLSFYYTEDDTPLEEGAEDPADLEENKPYFNELHIVNSYVTLGGLKIDGLYAYENATVVINTNDYMSLGHIEANTSSTIYISSLYYDEEEEINPLRIHNTTPDTSIFCALNYGRIYDTLGRELYFDEAIVKSYIFECSSHGEISLPNIVFTSRANEFQAAQYRLTSYGSLWHPNVMLGSSEDNYIEVNTKLQGVLWGGGSQTSYLRDDGTWSQMPIPVGEGTTTKYLRDDGTWSQILDTKTKVISKNYTLTEDDDKKVILVSGDYAVTLSNIGIDTSFYIKNISPHTISILLNDVTIDRFTDFIKLTLNEYVHIIQYSSNAYCVIADDCEYIHVNRDTLDVYNKFNTYAINLISDDEAQDIKNNVVEVEDTYVSFEGGNDNVCCGSQFIVKVENDNLGDDADYYKCSKCGKFYKTVWG
jgi:hypothetical protein